MNTAQRSAQISTRARPIIGLLDSGISRHQLPQLHSAAAFCTESAAAFCTESAAAFCTESAATFCTKSAATSRQQSSLNQTDYQDRLGHGSTLAQVLIDQLPQVQLCVARIFDRKLTASASQTAAGIDWLVAAGVQVINLSFGLRQDRLPLAQACQRALDAGVVLVAASPAMGEPVYPARYPGVIRVTGDARCQPNQYSWSPSRQADFGACVRAGHPQVIGASVAAAYISARVGRYLQAHPGRPLDAAHLQEWLREGAFYQGAQRPFALIPWARRLTWQGGAL